MLFQAGASLNAKAQSGLHNPNPTPKPNPKPHPPPLNPTPTPTPNPSQAQSGRSPLGEAVRLRELETCRLLVAARADINAHLPGEESLLHVA